MKSLPSTRLYAAMALVSACAASAGTYAGFRLGGWWGSQAGAIAGVGTVLVSARLTTRLCSLQTEASLRRIVVGDGRAEGTAEAVLQGLLLYEAAVFPLAPGGVSTQERLARRTVAYRLAAYDSLPRSVQVAAAEALEAIDHGQDAKRAQAAVRALDQAVRECRAGHVHVRDDQAP
ncbi:hypothetical protein [Streptomyces sp. Tue6028]|uniref:hypothetical protein n=1 Tax=Streptomyces sp. Tue6028 TaxID=2036037 RepID=UPI003D732443